MWDCAETRLCECGAIGRSTSIHHIRKQDFHAMIYGKHEEFGINLLFLWRRIVIQYMTLTLTLPADRLPAIAGVAEMVGKARKASYLAGLWSDSLQHDLLWYRSENSAVPQPESVRLRAPTWSWAAVEGPVSYSQHLFHTPREPQLYCEFLEGQCKSKGKNVSGFVRLRCSKLKIDGETTLWSNLRKMRLNFHEDREDVRPGEYYVIRIARLWEDECLVLRLLDAQASFTNVLAMLRV